VVAVVSDGEKALLVHADWIDLAARSNAGEAQVHNGAYQRGTPIAISLDALREALSVCAETDRETFDRLVLGGSYDAALALVKAAAKASPGLHGSHMWAAALAARSVEACAGSVSVKVHGASAAEVVAAAEELLHDDAARKHFLASVAYAAESAAGRPAVMVPAHLAVSVVPMVVPPEPMGARFDRADVIRAPLPSSCACSAAQSVDLASDAPHRVA
jgi:hypothetical protein